MFILYANKPVVFLSFARFQAGYQPTVSLVVTWGGATVFSELNPGEQRYHTFTFNVVGTGSDTLLFTSANDTSYTFLDDVSVTLVSTPEPSTLISAAVAILACVGNGRRRGRARLA